MIKAIFSVLLAIGRGLWKGVLFLFPGFGWALRAVSYLGKYGVEFWRFAAGGLSFFTFVTAGKLLGWTLTRSVNGLVQTIFTLGKNYTQGHDSNFLAGMVEILESVWYNFAWLIRLDFLIYCITFYLAIRVALFTFRFIREMFGTAANIGASAL